MADGRYSLEFGARWQGCNKPENYCLFPGSTDLKVDVIVGAGGAATTAAGEGSPAAEEKVADAADAGAAAGTTGGARRTLKREGPPASENCADEAGSEGAGAGAFVDLMLAKIQGVSGGGEAAGPGILFLLLVFLGGIASSFTPCVYPMIPITVSVIGASADQSRQKAFVMSCIYVAGIATTYTVLGLAASKTGGVFGAALQNPLVLVGVAGMMGALALAMMGLYEFALPAGLTTRASMLGGGGGGLGAFVVGTVAGVVAAPCTGPVVAYLLLEIVESGWSTVDGALVMMAYSLGLGMLFLVIGTFSGAMAAMPRSGTWMVTVKKVFGVVLFGAMVFYLSQAFDVWDAQADHTLSWTEPLKDVLWAGVLLLGGWVALGGKAGLGNTKRLGGAVVVLAVGGFILFAPEEQREAIIWDADHDATLAASAKSGKPAIVDFTADWCAACKELEHYTYTDPAVVKCSQDFEKIMFDATADTPEFGVLKDTYDIKGLPAVFFLCPDGEVLDELTLKGFEAADAFLDKMNIALRTCK